MVDIALQTRILSLLRDGRSVVIAAAPDQAATDRPARTRDWTPGQPVEARVASRLPDGRVVVDVDGALFQVRLPEKTEVAVGQRLPLTVVRAGPEPTFLLLPTADALAGPTAASEVRLSHLASQVASLLGNHTEGANPTATAPVARSEPLLSAPPSSGAALVAPLRQAFETSGLFYESHQAEWVGGTRPLETLQQEPQARVAREVVAQAGERDETAQGNPARRVDARDPAVSASSPPRTEGPARPAASLEPAGASPALPRTDSPPASAGASEPARAAASATRPDSLAAPAALPPGVAGILDRQLDALATQQITWQGQVWPGQAMRWQVEERTGGGSGDEPPAQWRTHLRLELPRLGAVNASLDLQGQALRVVIDAGGGDATAASLRAGEGDLARLLEARGLRLDGFRVKTDGDA